MLLSKRTVLLAVHLQIKYCDIPMILFFDVILTPPPCSLLQLDDAALQIYKDGDYGVYLDLESSLAEQAEEIEGLQGR